ncbi:4Fe-4S dicluster domain-containing protein [Thioalkalicoccus limnaeus]|uniref:4Fe-4S dicluster domain-containing protein n=1 Tax=Thioalkalicoccus limnaeus TaxID=120681 RepID=A0ABV4BD23_9GAMM
MYAVARLDLETCNGCKICIQTCPEPNTIAFIPEQKKVRVIVEKCKGCGVCVVKCPKECLLLAEITMEETK